MDAVRDDAAGLVLPLLRGSAVASEWRATTLRERRSPKIGSAFSTQAKIREVQRS
jgi:hypothetical protein